MELHQLEYFVAVADELHFTRAARRLHVVQSAVSAAVRALEANVGAALFERNSKAVTLTAEGAALLPYARQVLAGVRDGATAVAEAQHTLHGTIRLGTMSSVSPTGLPEVLARFHHEHPAVNVRLRMSTAGSAGLIDWLLADEVDAAMLFDDGELPPTLDVQPLVDVPMRLAMPADHPLTALSGIDLSTLAAQDLIEFPRGYGNRTQTERLFAQAGLRSNPGRVEVANMMESTEFVRHGLGLAIIPEFVAERAAPEVVWRPIDGDLFRWSVSLAVVRARRQSKALQTLRAMLPAVSAHHP